MAKSKNGAHGPLRGKVGSLIYSSWRGIDYVRANPGKRAAPNEKEKGVQYVFGTPTQGWMSPIRDYLRIGFKNYTHTNQGLTAAKSYMYKHALTQDGFNSFIDPEKMLVSYGDLGLADNLQVELIGEQELVFSWDTGIGKDKAPDDQVMLMAYNIAEKQANYSLGGDFRKAGTAKLSLAGLPKGEFHIYLSFVANDRSRQSNSAYLGVLELV